MSKLHLDRGNCDIGGGKLLHDIDDIGGGKLLHDIDDIGGGKANIGGGK